MLHLLLRSCVFYLSVSVFLVTLHAPPTSACPDLASAPHSQWEIEVHNGVSWLITPCGERFLSIGVNVVNGGYHSRHFKGRLSYHWRAFYPDLTSWATTTHQRLEAWGFNTIGAWSLKSALLPLPFIPDLELGRESSFLWADPFRPTMEKELCTWARRLVVPYKNNPYRIGYFSDNEIGWWDSILFTFYLHQPATNYTKQKLLALLREHYANNWQRFTQDFVPPAGVSSFAQLLKKRSMNTQLRPGGEGMQMIRRWTNIMAEHYYRSLQRALREADSQALFFGDRLQIYYDPDAVRAMVPYVDAIATNYNVDDQNGSISHFYFDGLQKLTGNKPVLVSEWFFAAHENRSGNRNNGLLMMVQTQAERARGAKAAAQELAKLPQIVGIHWFQYYDHPLGGRPDKEDYNFGLVDLYDQPYEELTEAFSRINPQLAEIHQKATPFSSATPQGTPFVIPEAAIDLQDHSLRDWPKAQALVPNLSAPHPDVPFGEMYLAWDRNSIYLATIAMNYYDHKFLAFDTTFPLAEAFRIDWGIDAGGGLQHYALYVVPSRIFVKEGPSLTRAHLCRTLQGSCKPVPRATVDYFARDEQPSVLLEVALPWKALGTEGPPPTRQLRMELAATSFYRNRWMSWSRNSPAIGLQDTTA